MDFGTNKTPVEIIKEGAFGGAYFRDIYSGITSKCYRKTWKEFDELKNIYCKYYCSNYYNASFNKYGVKCGTSLRFWENKRWINPIDHYGWFQWYFRYWLGKKSVDDERQINRWKGIESRFKGKLVEMIKGANGRFDDYSISPKIRQLLLHWGYELAESDLFFTLLKKIFFIFVNIKVSFYWFNKKELLKKAK